MLRYFFVFLIVFVFSLPVSAQETAPAPFLGNPMEKALSADTVRFPTAENTNNTAFRNSAQTEGVNSSVSSPMNNFSGWDIGPPPTLQSNGTQKRSALEQPDGNVPNSNIGNIPFATPLSTINPNYTQNFPNPQPNVQYNPQVPQYDYTALAAQYAAQQQNHYPYNSFSLNGQGGSNLMQGYSSYNYAPYQMPYQSQYQGMYGQMPYPMNAMGGIGGTSPFANNANVPKGDLFSNMMMSGAFEQNPVLYQAMLQQEELRHQQSIEEEEKKEREAAEKEKGEHWSAADYMPPIAGTLFSCIKTISPFNTPTGPDRGVGMPLMNRSWLDRPFYVGGFVGKMYGSELVSNMIEQKDGANGGLIFGFNVNDYWGLDGRLHFTSLDIKETANGETIYRQGYAAQFPDAVFIPPLTTRTNQLTIIDISAHYYPLGNAKFRPFFKYGIGAVRETFKDTYGVKHHIDTMAMPVGVGLRYWWNERLAIQMDIIDNVIFSRDITKTQSNWAFSVGVTYSFGSSKKRKPVSYWPYTPSNGSRR